MIEGNIMDAFRKLEQRQTKNTQLLADDILAAGGSGRRLTGDNASLSEPLAALGEHPRQTAAADAASSEAEVGDATGDVRELHEEARMLADAEAPACEDNALCEHQVLREALLEFKPSQWDEALHECVKAQVETEWALAKDSTTTTTTTP